MANPDAVIMPISTSQIVHNLMRNHQLSLKKIAQLLGVTTRTIYRLKSDQRVGHKLMAELITLYCQLELRNQ